MRRTPRNVSNVKRPKWMADDTLVWVIIVSRGEPRRTDEQMYAEVLDQVKGYTTAIGQPISDDMAERVTAAIADDYIYPTGSPGVQIYRASMQVYLSRAKKEVQ